MCVIQTISTNIKRRKEEMGMSVDTLSLKTGIKTATIQSIVGCQVEDTGVKKLIKISEALECTVLDLLEEPSSK